MDLKKLSKIADSVTEAEADEINRKLSRYEALQVSSNLDRVPKPSEAIEVGRVIGDLGGDFPDEIDLYELGLTVREVDFIRKDYERTTNLDLKNIDLDELDGIPFGSDAELGEAFAFVFVIDGESHDFIRTIDMSLEWFKTKTLESGFIVIYGLGNL